MAGPVLRCLTIAAVDPAPSIAAPDPGGDRFPTLEGIRGLAALAVLAFHAGTFTGLTGPVSTFVPVVFNFRDTGRVAISVLTVPAVGFYEGIVPMGASAPEATPAAEPSASESPAE